MWLFASRRKKKLVQTSERGYPSRFTCAIDQNGDVVCWGPLVSAKTYAVSGDGYYAKQIAVGENQVVILAYKNNDGILDENNTKVYSYSFLKSLLENKVQANSNIFRAAFANFSENEYFKSGFNSVIFKRGGYYDAEKYPANREAMFIGLKYPDQTLFASGRIVDKDDTNLVNNGVEALVPLPEGAYKEVAANTQHVCGIRADNGSIVCWGANDFGQSDAPAEYREFDSVAVGRFHTVALRKNGDVVCWGAGSTLGNGGALANSDVWPNYGQSKVPSDLLGKQVIQVGAGYYYSAALLVDGTVKVWGSFRGYTYSSSEGASDLPDTYRF